MNNSNRLVGLLKTLGPGLIFAGTSIGVSHVVQSTRAGANYGFALLWVVVLINIIKFPFFEFSPRYVVATGENLLVGYRRVGKWAFGLFCVLSLCTMFPIQAGVTIVTTGLFVNLFQWTHSVVLMSALVLFVCCLILLLGKYPLLDKLMKVMILVLGISTAFAFITAACKGSVARPEFMQHFEWSAGDIAFVVALMGWMPTTLEISVWHSFWCRERRKQTHYAPSLKEILFDFHLGYWGTMVMAMFFVCLGALVMYGTGETFLNSAAGFTGQVITLYTKALGQWSYPVIVAAAATTMFSTTLCCLDAFPRVISEIAIMIWPSLEEKREVIYRGWLIFISLVSLVIIGKFVQNMKALIDFATTLAFVATPIFAYINLHTVTDPHMPQECRPSRRLVIFSWISIVFLSAFSLFYIVWKFVL